MKNSSNGSPDPNGDGITAHGEVIQPIIPTTIALGDRDISIGLPLDPHIDDEQFQTQGPSDGSNGQYRKHPFGYNHPLWHLGWTDGRLGQPRETFEAALRAEFKSRWLKRVELVESKQSLDRAKLDDLKARHDRGSETLRVASDYFKEVWQERTHRYHEFSYVLAIGYLFIALILFLSDIPLTLKLVAKGFDLKTQVVDPKSNAVTLSVDDLILNFWGVVSQLWEPLVLALGIALAGVFVKFFLDEVLFRQEADKPRKKMVATLSVIMVIFVLTIVFLGVFRSRIQLNVQNSQYQLDRDNLEARLKGDGLTDPQIAQIMGTVNPPGAESTLAILTFTALTITLPVIAGVCFSAGWRRFKDAQRYRELKREIRKLERQFKTESEELHRTEAGIESAEKWLARQEKSDNIVEVETEWALSLYRHGYFRGLSVPETIDYGASLFQRAQKSAEKILAKRVRRRIWHDLNPSSQGTPGQ